MLCKKQFLTANGQAGGKFMTSGKPMTGGKSMTSDNVL